MPVFTKEIKSLLARDSRVILAVFFLWVLFSLLFPLPRPKNPESGQAGGKKKTTAAQCQGLQAWFDGYNEEYFLSQLPKNTVVEYGDLGPAVMGITFKDGGRFHIIISPEFNVAPNTAHLTILHEDCHIATWTAEFDAHGPKFQACMRRLYSEGAFEGLL